MTPDQLRAAGWVPHNEACGDPERFPDDLQVWSAHLGMDPRSRPDAYRMVIHRTCRGIHGDQFGEYSWIKPVGPIGLPSDQLPPLICGEVLPARYRSREEREAEYARSIRQRDDLPAQKPRYVIDHRSGCIAIHDTHHPGYARRGPGCHSKDPWCVSYTGGVPVYSTFNGSRYIHHWEVMDGDIAEAKAMCDRLNREHEAEWRARR